MWQEHTITELAVSGSIPAHLDGRYLRNGPNPIAEVDPQTYHWFTGDGMVHGVRLRDGRAEWYRNRWVRTPAVACALGEPAPRPAPSRTGLELVGANTNVISHAGRTLALVEGGITNYELTDDLDTVGPCDFDGTLHGGYTAHPKRDPDTGELHAVSYSFGRGNRVQYSVIGLDGRARRTVDVAVTGSPNDARLFADRKPCGVLRPPGHLQSSGKRRHRGTACPAGPPPGWCSPRSLAGCGCPTR